ncbi:hypothetical protein HKD37_01G001169 [Glycine soja]
MEGFLVSGKYIALQICDDEDVETMLESFKQQEQMLVLELYIEKDVADDGDDDDDYLVSNSYVEESLDEDDSVDDIFDIDDEVTDMIQPVRIVHAAEDTWKVTQWGGPHTCLNMTITQDHEKLDSDLIATCVVGMIREDPSIKVSLIQERINSEFAYKVSYKKAWLAKQKAIAIEYGDWEESYAKLSSWLTHMQNHSPRSYFQILHDDFIIGNMVSREHRQFHRVFWTFGQCKEAFKYCKLIIQVDGTHLYGKYRGTLLMATSQDGNGGVLPLAFAVVEGETLITWSWFLAHLREHVTDKNGICLIFDRHASIKSVVANEALGWQPPHGYHVYCVRHMASNFNRKFNNAKQKEMLKKLAYTPCKHIVDQNLEKFRQLSPAIATWIDCISKEKWTMAYD